MPSDNAIGAAACKLASTLSQTVEQLDFSEAVPWVYNPLSYAWEGHSSYLQKYARSSCETLLIGMNPGPWGMAQTGIPFGEIAAARDWLGIKTTIQKPSPEHPKRPIDGFACEKSEVSGRRLWGLFAERFESAEKFFDSHFVTNYCPLVFMEESARNVTPDKLPIAIRQELESHCDNHLRQLIELLCPSSVIGVGAFAEKCASRVLGKHSEIPIGRILHPSPASPAANRDWAGTATKQLIELGIWSS